MAFRRSPVRSWSGPPILPSESPWVTLTVTLRTSASARTSRSTRRGGAHHLPLVTQVPRGGVPRRKLELESVFEESPGHHSATLENELGLRAHEDCADLQHPLA